MLHERRKCNAASLESFQDELNRLVGQFENNLSQYKSNAYDEASLRNEFLNPFFRALGWDVENKAGNIPQHREVELESRTEIAGRKKRADYLFRTDRIDRFVCEAKKPAEELHDRYAFQAKRYAWNKGLVLSVLSDFEEMKIYVVGSRPYPEEVNIGLWKTYCFQQYPLVAKELWDLLSQSAVAGGSIDALVESLPRKQAAKGKAKQQWLFKPERIRALDVEFLNFLDEARRELAQDLLHNNNRAGLLEGTQLNEAVQHILDRLLFLRICEDRDIDTGNPLAHIIKSWREGTDTPQRRRAYQTSLPVTEERKEPNNPAKAKIDYSLWRTVVAHFRALDRRPPSHIPFFNGNLFKPHFCEDLEVGNKWIADFLDEVGDDESPYLFNVIPVEILGTIYERFLGKVVRPHGRGAVIEEKPEVRKAGGVYYTPRYIVDYIVEQTVGKLLENTTPKDSLKLRILDPACGSGSFLIRAFERVCEYWQTAFTKDAALRRDRDCWIDPLTKDVHLTTNLKRRILTACIYGVDIDPGAVEVTQLSLYLKMLEGENRTTLARERDLFGHGNETAILPPLQDNIKNGNSLIASDFSMMPEDLLRVKAFDWQVQFSVIMKENRFDAVIGNPPYGMVSDDSLKEYFERVYRSTEGRYDTFELFLERALLCTKKEHGRAMFIIPTPFLTNVYSRKLRKLLLQEATITEITNFGMDVFEDPTVHTCIVGYTPFKSHNNQVNIRKQVVKQEELYRKYNYSIAQSILGLGENQSFDIFISPILRTLLDKIALSTTPLAEICHIRQCIKTGDDEKYVVSSTQRPGHLWKPSLRGRSIDRYSVIEKDLWVKYGDWLARNWQNKSFYETPKIAVRETGARIIAALDTDERFFLSSLYSVYLIDNTESMPLKYLLGIINSLFATWYVRLIAFDLTEGAFTKIRTNQFGRLPIPISSKTRKLDKSKQEKIISLVDKMLLLVPKLWEVKGEKEKTTIQNAITATDRQIDEIVYELYGLTKDEIELVEKD